MEIINIVDLPLDILYLIFQYLPYSSCKNISHTSSYFFNVFKTNKHFSYILKHGLQQKVLRLLCARGSYSNVLTYACKIGNNDITKYCLKYTKPTLSNSTIACMNGHLPIIKMLNVRPTLDMLWLACECGYTEIVQYLIQLVEPQADYNKALIIACEKGDLDTFKILLQHPKVNPGDRNDYCFRFCCRQDMIPFVDILLHDKRVNPAARDNEAFIEACIQKNFECVKKLICDPRISPEARDNMALITCSRQWNIQMVKLLWTDVRVRYQFKFCFSQQDIKHVKYLLS